MAAGFDANDAKAVVSVLVGDALDYSPASTSRSDGWASTFMLPPVFARLAGRRRGCELQISNRSCALPAPGRKYLNLGTTKSADRLTRRSPICARSPLSSQPLWPAIPQPRRT